MSSTIQCKLNYYSCLFFEIRIWIFEFTNQNWKLKPSSRDELFRPLGQPTYIFCRTQPRLIYIMLTNLLFINLVCFAMLSSASNPLLAYNPLVGTCRSESCWSAPTEPASIPTSSSSTSAVSSEVKLLDQADHQAHYATEAFNIADHIWQPSADEAVAFGVAGYTVEFSTQPRGVASIRMDPTYTYL